MTDVRCSPRQTDRHLNQSILLSLSKSNSSSHVLCAGCSRLLILSEGTPLTSEPLPGIVLMQIRRGNQFNVAQFDQTSAYWASAPHENLPILTLPPPPAPLILCPPPPPDEGSTPWPQGQPVSLWPTRLPLILLVYPSDPVRPGYNTWPRPRDGPIGVQGKCPFLYVCLQAALSGPCPIFTCGALFLVLSHKKITKKPHSNTILFGRLNFALKIKVFLSLGLFHCIQCHLTAFIQRSLTYSLLFPLLLFIHQALLLQPFEEKGSMSRSWKQCAEPYHTHSKVMMW